ncbi:hypothetical protein BKA82DRAFT_1000594 [Pisolithus tinctorius]|uniref:Uncharacterized protein n=1 Tax=Pisolithus tinctorius Marx 270 TaxID=870435 RepID=A0A0C3J5Z3_PISTI|nr:hypothetical protein BKA82DRAFT_1000594 [Pisolithus tinctorius]KIO04478.1 hypothetical protein M404DRAFT_1000594 [Pisolithus tinctorius Marx 270]
MLTALIAKWFLPAAYLTGYSFPYHQYMCAGLMILIYHPSFEHDPNSRPNLLRGTLIITLTSLSFLAAKPPLYQLLR